MMDTTIVVYSLPQSTGRILYGVRVGPHVVCNGYTTEQLARKAGADWLLASIIFPKSHKIESSK